MPSSNGTKESWKRNIFTEEGSPAPPEREEGDGDVRKRRYSRRC